MGTNYYTVPRKPSLYRDCYHIGKSSLGWMFLFEGYLDNPIIKSRDDWYKYIEDNDLLIFNEYNEEVPVEDFKKMVERMQVEGEHNPENFDYDVVNVDGYRFRFKDFS